MAPTLIQVNVSREGIFEFGGYRAGRQEQRAQDIRSVLNIRFFKIVTEKINEVSQFNRLKDEDLEKWLEDYSLGELWEKNYLRGRPS